MRRLAGSFSLVIILTLIVFVLAGIVMFFHRGAFIIEMFFNAVVNEACGAINVLLIAAVTRELVHCISSLTQPSVGDRAFVSSAFALRGGEG